jgi:hypothetical protein
MQNSKYVYTYDQNTDTYAQPHVTELIHTHTLARARAHYKTCTYKHTPIHYKES